MFSGSLTGDQLGFGRLMQAFRLAEQLEELTWEEIRDWRLEGTGWGLIVQLDRYADALEEIGLPELMDMVRNGEYTIGQIRTALRNSVRFDVEFDDVLARLTDGAKAGEIMRLYRIADELGIDPAELDAYLAMGVSLSDMSRAAKMAKSSDAGWEEILVHFQAGNSWSDIRQAYRMANDDATTAEILEIGLKEYRRSLHEKSRTERADERDRQTASQFAKKYGTSEDDVMDIFENTCASNWNCVRAYFRELDQEVKVKKQSKRKNQ